MKSSYDPFSRMAGVLVAAAALAVAFSSPCLAAEADPKAPAPEAAAPGGTGEKPGFDVGLVDKSVKPCNDFFQFACGGWLAKNPVPPSTRSGAASTKSRSATSRS